MSQTRELPALPELKALYEDARFLDAWRATEHLWADRALAEHLSVEQLVFAGRLAERLGSPKYRRACLTPSASLGGKRANHFTFLIVGLYGWRRVFVIRHIHNDF